MYDINYRMVTPRWSWGMDGLRLTVHYSFSKSGAVEPGYVWLRSADLLENLVCGLSF